ncbi:predicted protein [Phaeodactylum tricornutum CCAP 1055/1]|uniref:RanBP-type and C3HC4-type zinc finger-containing protein 1 n=1 Tax=Phaeodactylum tricornutum (strain CCAP 1055/1) TaxID=556484 RepID=B5Y4F6_PHATC|nr:predicted protein [Phaeodactylum tricornutum CCAP 1055/1]ACI65472.1 predicted protein [Phaeodactylum tricornutum CCAP 1055/1]|eukprot:XP_002186002.1 predicted protein [Phaeodactylum tricornutum CCAP 1055/1]
MSDTGWTFAAAADACDDEDVWTQPPFTPTNPLHRALQAWDASLRCGICRELFRIPTSVVACGHVFCACCVRDSFQTQLYRTLKKSASCPLCRDGKVVEKDPSFAKTLRPNPLLEQLVLQYQSLRKPLYDALCQSLETTAPSGGGGSVGDDTNGSGASGVNNREGGCGDVGVVDSDGSVGVVGSRAVSATNEGAVHANTRSNTVTRSNHHHQPYPNPHSVNTDDDETTAPTTQATPLPPPPLVPQRSLNYHGLKRKRLQELCQQQGLDTTGTDETLKNRHRAYVAFHNAHVDSVQPWTAAELIRIFNQRERAKARVARPRSLIPPTTDAHGNIAYDPKLRAGFAKLVAQARKQQQEQQCQHREEQSQQSSTTPITSSTEFVTEPTQQAPQSTDHPVTDASAPVMAPTHVPSMVNPYRQGHGTTPAATRSNPRATTPGSQSSEESRRRTTTRSTNQYRSPLLHSDPVPNGPPNAMAVLSSGSETPSNVNPYKQRNCSSQPATSTPSSHETNSDTVKSTLSANPSRRPSPVDVLADCNTNGHASDDHNNTVRPTLPQSRKRTRPHGKVSPATSSLLNTRKGYRRDSAQGSWTCGKCTFFNQKHKWRTSCCEMCATPRSEATEQCVGEGQHVNVD